MEIVSDDVEVDHEAGTVGTSGCEKVADALGGHIDSLFQFQSSGRNRRTKGMQEPLRNQPVETPDP
ncbi:hypothetical protein GCM10010520_39860 [Rhizobium viscosum]